MAMPIQQISPVAHFPLVLGVIRKLHVAALIEPFCPPPPAPVLSGGRGVEALLLAILDGPHALDKVGARLEDRGMFPLLQPGLTRTALYDSRLGQILDGLFAAHLHRLVGAIALHALEVYALSTPWLHQDTTTITLYGAYEEKPHRGAGPVAPRPAYGHSNDGHDELKHVLLRLGVSREGLPLRMGLRDGHTSDRTAPPVAIAEGGARGLDGVRGMVADSKAYGQRTWGLCLEQGVGLITLVPRTCAVRQEVEAWGQQHGVVPALLAKPGRPRQEPPRRWHGQSGVRRVPVEDAEGRLDVAAIRFLVVHSRPLASQAAAAYAAAQAKEAERGAAHVQHGEARWLAWAAAAAAMAEYAGRGQGRRGRKPRPWRYHGRPYRVEAVSGPHKRMRRGRPPKAEGPPGAVRYRLGLHPEALGPSEEAHGWTGLAAPVEPEGCTDVELLQAAQEPHITVEPGFRWIKTPAAISPVWLAKPERRAALAMLTVVGLLV